MNDDIYKEFLDSSNAYIFSLFYKYAKELNISKKYVDEYLKANNICTSEQLKKENPNFSNWLEKELNKYLPADFIIKPTLDLSIDLNPMDDSIYKFMTVKVYSKYIFNLFLEYVKEMNISEENAIKYLKQNNIVTAEQLIGSNPEFSVWLENLSIASEYSYVDLYKRGFINPETIELDKGVYDTVVSEDTQTISKYASTYGKENSSLVNDNAKGLIKLKESGKSEIIKGVPLFILSNPTDKELSHYSKLLFNSNSKLLLNFWGIARSKAKISSIMEKNQILKSIGNGTFIDFNQDKESDIYYGSVLLNDIREKRILL